MNLIPGAWRYLDSLLKGSGALAAVVEDRVYLEAAPESAPYPFVVCSLSSERSLSTVGGDRLVAQPLYLIRAVVNDRDKISLKRAADAIETALAPPAGGVLVSDVTLDGTTYAVRSWSENDYSRAEFDQGIRYDSLGGYYRLFIEAAV